jgi:hypothetical protein
MAQDYLLKFGSLALSALAEAASGVPTFTGSYVTGPATQIFPTIVDLGAIGGQNNRSELFAKVNINVTALSSSSTLADATNFWTFNPVVEASKDGTNYSIIATLPTDIAAYRVFYAAGGVTIAGDSSMQLFVPLSAPAGTQSQNASGAAEDNYRYFRVRLLCRPGVTGGGTTGANRTITLNATAAIVNTKDGII